MGSPGPESSGCEAGRASCVTTGDYCASTSLTPTLDRVRLKGVATAADSEGDSRLGTDGNQNRLRSFEKGRRTTPPFSCARPESARADSGRAEADPFMGSPGPEAPGCEVGRAPAGCARPESARADSSHAEADPFLGSPGPEAPGVKSVGRQTSASQRQAAFSRTGTCWRRRLRLCVSTSSATWKVSPGS